MLLHSDVTVSYVQCSQGALEAGHPMALIGREVTGLAEEEKVGNRREDQCLPHRNAKWVGRLTVEGERRSWSCEYAFVS